ncbi:MAG: HIT family protein [bacterium]|nr:HIT family protein [bacterium]
MKDSIFTKIINRELPAEIIYEDEQNIAILSINPHHNGHSLVISKVQVDEFQDLSEQDFLSTMSLVRKLAKVIKRVFKPARIGLVIEGFAVPHVHIHLIPINQPSDLDHTNAGSATMEQLSVVGQKIRDDIARNGL